MARCRRCFQSWIWFEICPLTVGVRNWMMFWLLLKLCGAGRWTSSSFQRTFLFPSHLRSHCWYFIWGFCLCSPSTSGAGKGFGMYLCGFCAWFLLYLLRSSTESVHFSTSNICFYWTDTKEVSYEHAGPKMCGKRLRSQTWMLWTSFSDLYNLSQPTVSNPQTYSGYVVM